MISDRQGFEYAELGPQRLPGTPASYLDVYPSGSAEPAYGFEPLSIEGRTFVRYSRYLRVNPNDSQTNRGAYLSAGFLAGRALPVHAAANCMDLVAQIVGHLKGLLGPDNSVGRHFRLADYTYDGDLTESAIERPCSPLLLLDVLMQGLNAQGSLSWKGRKPIFIDAARLTREDEIEKHLFYFGKGTPGIQLKLERDREKVRRLTQQLAHAASYADQVQDEWLAYQAAMQERLPALAVRGTELRDLIDEVERLTESVDAIGSTGASAGASSPRFAPSAFTGSQSAAGSAVYPGPWMQRPRARGAARRTNRSPADARRDRRSRRTFRWAFRPIALGFGAALLIGVLVTVALEFLRGGLDHSVTETLATPADDVPTGLAAAASSAEEPGPAVGLGAVGASEPVSTGPADSAPSSVAQERAALGQSRPK